MSDWRSPSFIETIQSKFSLRTDEETEQSESLLIDTNSSDDEQLSKESVSFASCCPTLTYSERTLGYLMCMTLGHIFSLGSLSRFRKLLQGDPLPFVSMLTFGNVLSLTSSLFFSGPAAQLDKMFDETRRITTVCYLVSIVSTVILAFLVTSKFSSLSGLLIFSCLCQCSLLTWYTMSYIPFARGIAKRWGRKKYDNAVELIWGVRTMAR